MEARKAFTLIEMIVVLIIVGIAVAFAIPSLTTSIEQTKARAAAHNLMAIAAAESKYYEDYGYYCVVNCTNTTSINSSLSLSISTNDSFGYSVSSGNPATGYECQANENGGVGMQLVIYNNNTTPQCWGGSVNQSYNCPSELPLEGP